VTQQKRTGQGRWSIDRGSQKGHQIHGRRAGPQKKKLGGGPHQGAKSWFPGKKKGESSETPNRGVDLKCFRVLPGNPGENRPKREVPSETVQPAGRRGSKNSQGLSRGKISKGRGWGGGGGEMQKHGNAQLSSNQKTWRLVGVCSRRKRQWKKRQSLKSTSEGFSLPGPARGNDTFGKVDLQKTFMWGGGFPIFQRNPILP